MRILIPVEMALYGFLLGSLALAWYTSTWRTRLGWGYAMDQPGACHGSLQPARLVGRHGAVAGTVGQPKLGEQAGRWRGSEHP